MSERLDCFVYKVLDEIQKDINSALNIDAVDNHDCKLFDEMPKSTNMVLGLDLVCKHDENHSMCSDLLLSENNSEGLNLKSLKQVVLVKPDMIEKLEESVLIASDVDDIIPDYIDENCLLNPKEFALVEIVKDEIDVDRPALEVFEPHMRELIGEIPSEFVGMQPSDLVVILVGKPSTSAGGKIGENRQQKEFGVVSRGIEEMISYGKMVNSSLVNLGFLFDPGGFTRDRAIVLSNIPDVPFEATNQYHNPILNVGELMQDVVFSFAELLVRNDCSSCQYKVVCALSISWISNIIILERGTCVPVVAIMIGFDLEGQL